ncbi:vacuolar protein sorting protein [Corchorus capsularis]|uniref:Vacuolar protein sorting protein n=1 Tax=Corchorus capsularis TaxID=210143 RepID=A0A1R3GFN8_COCAP|nr:vacuolar protein sorting protein [Corchorus capsularis]
MAPLFPPRNPPFRPRLLLVLHLLPLSFPPHVQNDRRRLPESTIDLLPPLQQLHIDDHVVFMAGVFTVVSGAGDPVHDAGLRGGVRIQILDGNRVAERLLPFRIELPNPAVRV